MKKKKKKKNFKNIIIIILIIILAFILEKRAFPRRPKPCWALPLRL